MNQMPKDNDTIQTPIQSGFGFQTTACEALGDCDLTGKTAIVTGGYSGIGVETVRALAAGGANVIVPARSPRKAQDALRDIPVVELEELDLMDHGSIDAFSHRFLSSGRPLHILIHNAGIMAPPLRRDARGYESQFATNHLGHFQLTAQLWPALTQAGGARVVALSSRGHRLGRVDFDDPNFVHREYDKWTAYGQSKTAAVLFAAALDKKGKSRGVRAFSVHPGLIMTELSRHLTAEEKGPKLVKDVYGRPVSDQKADRYKTAEQGAATSVWCAVSPQLSGLGGVYCEDVDIAELVTADSPKGTGVRPWAVDPELAEQLWLLSEKLTGVKFAL